MTAIDEEEHPPAWWEERGARDRADLQLCGQTSPHSRHLHKHQPRLHHSGLFGYTRSDATSMVVLERRQGEHRPLLTASGLHDATLTTIPVQIGAPEVFMAKYWQM